MRLTLYTDYSLRVLIYLAAHPGRMVATEEISRAYGISSNHLVKVVNNLGHAGFVLLKRGRSGGIRLAREPREINVGAVARAAEPDFHIVECFDPEANTCPIAPVCGLKSPLHEASRAFLAVLDKYSLDDLVGTRRRKLYQESFLSVEKEPATPKAGG